MTAPFLWTLAGEPVSTIFFTTILSGSTACNVPVATNSPPIINHINTSFYYKIDNKNILGVKTSKGLGGKVAGPKTVAQEGRPGCKKRSNFCLTHPGFKVENIGSTVYLLIPTWKTNESYYWRRLII